MPGYDPNRVYRDTEPLTDSSGRQLNPLDASPDLAKTGLPGMAGSGQRMQLPRSLSMEQIAAVAKESENPSPENRRLMEKYADELKISQASQGLKSRSKSFNIPAPWLDH